MPDVIKLLPDALANKIAAGEVVQRPSSVVKELLENAIDANASNIKLIFKDAGKTLIQVIDDGDGMSETDARMSLERHATSKLLDAEGLFSIKTMGFRGEALASIAAVSQMEIKTKQNGKDLGTLILVESSKIKKQEPTASEVGTSIAVKNLFYNIPARRNFLKSNSIEIKHIIDEFQRIALSRYDIGFSLYVNNEQTYNLPSSKLSQRVVHLFGNNYKEQLITCKGDLNNISIHGYIGKPAFAKKTRGEQFFFVNNRFVKSAYLHHAILKSYEGLIQPNTHPFYALFIEIDPIHIDINVHPTKTEIKFDDEKIIYYLVKTAIKQALGVHHISPTLDFNSNINFGNQLIKERVNLKESHKERQYSQFKNTPTAREHANLENWDKIFEENKGKISVSDFKNENDQDNRIIFVSQMDMSESETPKKNASSSILHLHNKYIIVPVKSGMMVLDQQAAHERILYEKYLNNLHNDSGASQQLLFPQIINLNPNDIALVIEMEEELRSLGFIIEHFGKDDLLIKGCPTTIVASTEKEIIEGLLELYKNNLDLKIGKKENLARSIAKKSGIKMGDNLNEEEISQLIDQLFACELANYTPDGRPTFYITNMTSIESNFKKK